MGKVISILSKKKRDVSNKCECREFGPTRDGEPDSCGGVKEKGSNLCSYCKGGHKDGRTR